MGYTKSQFTGNLELIGGNWVYTIESKDEKTWLRINIDSDADRSVVIEIQYIIEHLREIVQAISNSTMTGKGDGIYISEEAEEE